MEGFDRSEKLKIWSFIVLGLEGGRAGKTYLKGRLSTIDLLNKVACFETKVNNIFNINAVDLN